MNLLRAVLRLSCVLFCMCRVGFVCRFCIFNICLMNLLCVFLHVVRVCAAYGSCIVSAYTQHCSMHLLCVFCICCVCCVC